MRKEQFLRELGALLRDIPENERAEAMQYYEDYFADAGPEMEEQVARELGSPEQVAKTIKADLGIDDGEFSERGYQDERFVERQELQARPGEGDTAETEKQKSGEKAKKRPFNGWKIACIILLCVILFPVIFAAAILVLALAVGLVCVAAGLVAGAFALALGLLIGGGAGIIVGLTRLIWSPAVGIAAVGMGLLLMALGLLAAVFTAWCLFRIVPWIIRGIVGLLRIPFNRRKEVSQ